jgi:hypothetical protein
LPGEYEEFQDFHEVLRLILLTKALHFLQQTVDILEIIEDVQGSADVPCPLPHRYLGFSQFFYAESILCANAEGDDG